MFKYHLPLKAFRACRAESVRATLCARETGGSFRAGEGLARGAPALASILVTTVSAWSFRPLQLAMPLPSRG